MHFDLVRPICTGNSRVVVGVLGLLTLVAVSACSSSTGEDPATSISEATTSTASTPEPPSVDQSIHSVPLEDVIFDTFDGRSVRLNEASAATIRRLRDAIRPVYEPVNYLDVDGGDWLSNSDTVIGYVSDSGAFAYSIKFLNSHELVNDTIDSIPLLVSYCPLCGSGVVYDRRLSGVEYVFGNTNALFENDLVMFDHATGSYWFQVGGEAIVGELTGSKLEVLPSTTLPWGDWKALHPDTRILSRAQGFPSTSNYERDPFSSYKPRVASLQFPFPVSEEKIDARLSASTITVTVQAGDEEKAYPVETMGDSVANDVVGAEPVVVFSREDGSWGTAFSRMVNGEALTFSLEDGVITDAETGSAWDLFGQATEGKLAGTSLTALPTRRAFWFSIAITVPDIELWEQSP